MSRCDWPPRSRPRLRTNSHQSPTFLIGQPMHHRRPTLVSWVKTRPPMPRYPVSPIHRPIQERPRLPPPQMTFWHQPILFPTILFPPILPQPRPIWASRQLRRRLLRLPRHLHPPRHLFRRPRPILRPSVARSSRPPHRGDSRPPISPRPRVSGLPSRHRHRRHHRRR